MGHAAKGNKNSHLGNRYADLASVCDACLPHLSAQCIAVLQPVSANGPLVTVETILVHSSGEFIKSSLTLVAYEATKGGGFSPSDKPQSVGSAITYARRYSLSALVGVSADDDDGNAASGRTRPAPATSTTDVADDARTIEACATQEILRTTASAISARYVRGSPEHTFLADVVRRCNEALRAQKRDDITSDVAAAPTLPPDSPPPASVAP